MAPESVFTIFQNAYSHGPDSTLTAAASYMVMGTMLGIAVAARRLGITTEEAIEEKKPLVN